MNEKSAWDGKYSKPSGGIPKSDLSEGVQDSLDEIPNLAPKDKIGNITLSTSWTDDQDEWYSQIVTSQVLNVTTDSQIDLSFDKTAIDKLSSFL